MPELERLSWFVTDFADQAVVLPLAGVVAVLLYAFGWRRGAVVWTAVVVSSFGLMLVLKIGFGACGAYLTGGQVESPSGHTAAAGVIYGSLVALLLERMLGRTIWSVCAIVAVVSVVGVSRILLGAHTVPEVVIGAGVGLVAALIMVRGIGPSQAHSFPVLLLLPLCGVLFLFHGLHLQAEQRINRLARWFTPFQVCRQAQPNRVRVLASIPGREPDPFAAAETWTMRP